MGWKISGGLWQGKLGPRSIRYEQDDEGHGTYTVVHRVMTNELNSGPTLALRETPGLPQLGDPWFFGNEFNPWAWCRAYAKVIPIIETGHPIVGYDIEQIFSTKPFNTCQDDGFIEDPLLVPDRFSGNFRHQKERIVRDHLNNLVRTSSLELFDGPNAEFDNSKPTIVVEQNRPTLELGVILNCMDAVNDAVMWGFDIGSIKLSRVTWEEKFTGYCQLYYSRKLEFEIDENGFARELADYGTKYLYGQWSASDGVYYVKDIDGDYPDATNPSHFIQAKDLKGNETRTPLRNGLPPNAVIRRFDGSNFPGEIYNEFTNGPPDTKTVQKYPLRDFTKLRLPDRDLFD